MLPDWILKRSVTDIVKAKVTFIMTCLAGTILHDFHSIPENVVNSLHNGLHHIWYINVEIWIALCMHFVVKEQGVSKNSYNRYAWDEMITGGLTSLLMN